MYVLADENEITPAALNRLFTEAHTELPEVDAVEATALDGGYGYLSRAYRLNVAWIGAGADAAPRTLIAKLPLPARLGEDNPSALRMFRREAMFHRVVADETPLRTARCWAAELDEESGLATLVFEDIGAFEEFGDDDTISNERVENALSQLARHHALFWNSPRLEEMDWLAYPAVTGVDQVSAERFAKCWPSLVASGAYELSSTQLRLGELLSERLDAVYAALHAGPFSLTHADLHQENLFFDGDEAVFIDWAAAERSNPAKDVAKLTGSCLDPKSVRQIQPEMIRHYRDELARTVQDAASKESSRTGLSAGNVPSLADLERYVHLATCHYLAMMTFLSDMRDFKALAEHPENRTDFTTSRVISACDREEIVSVVESL